MLDTILFDMDGVLIDSEKFWKQASKEVFTSVGATWSEDIAEHTKGKTTRAVTEYWYSLFPWNEKSIEEVEQAVIDRVDELIRFEGEINKGVLKVLNDLTDEGFKIGLVSNSPHSLIETVVNQLQIKSFFNILVSGTDVVQGKPAPDVYLLAAKLLKSEPSTCLVFEDSITGITAAKKANMFVIALPDPSEFSHTKFEIANCKLESLEEFVLHDFVDISVLR